MVSTLTRLDRTIALQEDVRIELCSDCVMLVANGDTSGADADYDYEAIDYVWPHSHGWLLAVDHFCPDHEYDPDDAHPEDCTEACGPFTNSDLGQYESTCDGCRRRLFTNWSAAIAYRSHVYEGAMAQAIDFAVKAGASVVPLGDPLGGMGGAVRIGTDNQGYTCVVADAAMDLGVDVDHHKGNVHLVFGTPYEAPEVVRPGIVVDLSYSDDVYDEDGILVNPWSSEYSGDISGLSQQVVLTTGEVGRARYDGSVLGSNWEAPEDMTVAYSLDWDYAGPEDIEDRLRSAGYRIGSVDGVPLHQHDPSDTDNDA